MPRVHHGLESLGAKITRNVMNIGRKKENSLFASRRKSIKYFMERPKKIKNKLKFVM